MTTTLIPDLETEPETETTAAETVACIICDGGGTVCERCTRPQPRCECEGGCDRTVVCEDCDGDGTKPAGAVEASDYDAVSARSDESVAGEADLREDEPMPAWKVELVGQIQRAEHEAQDAERDMLAAKETHKGCKEIFDGKVANLRKLIRQLDAAEKPMPLLDTLDKPEPVEANGHADTWRSTCIDALQAHDLSEKIVTKLRDKSIETLGDLADFQARHGEFWPKEIKGLGPQKAAKVTDAQAAFWAANPEFCGNNGAA